jgi:DNA-directed RNA polymerase specialized sigma24 family protein
MNTGATAEGEEFQGSGSMASAVDLSFEEVYLRFRDPLFHYLRRFAVDDDEAADLTAKTFERALVRLPSYRGRRLSLAAWLFRIARSQGVDAKRRGRLLRPLDLIRPEQHPLSE